MRHRTWAPVCYFCVGVTLDGSDIPALCAKCDLYHLNRPEWLEPVLTACDAQFLENIGVTAPQRMDEYFRCVYCGTVQRDGIEFLILEDGRMVCGENCTPQND
jgi:hypothetical protein